MHLITETTQEMLTPHILAGRGQIINELHVHIGRETQIQACLMSSSRKTTVWKEHNINSSLLKPAGECIGIQSMTWILRATVIHKRGQSSKFSKLKKVDMLMEIKQMPFSNTVILNLT